MPEPVAPRRIQIAAEHLANADAIAVACRSAEIPYAVACALIFKESKGENAYGRHDGAGAMLSGFPVPPNEGNFAAFIYEVMRGRQSNGVSIAQITWAGKLIDGKRDGGYFTQMKARGLKPWVPHDSALFGLELLKANYVKHGTWEAAGAYYNGGTRPDADAWAYGRDLDAHTRLFRERFQR